MSPESLKAYHAENPAPEQEIADLRARLQTAEQQLGQVREEVKRLLAFVEKASRLDTSQTCSPGNEDVVLEAMEILSATHSGGCGKGRTDRLTIYVASKTKHAPMWLKFRDKGFPIVSTWIDEAGHGESSDLCDLAMRCIREAAEASFTVLYCEPGETLKGALMEAGSALASCREVRCVGTCDNLSPVLSLHPKWKAYQSVEEALAASIIGKEGGV